MAVAVRDPASSARVFRDLLGGEFLMGGDEPEQGFRWVQYRFPDGGKVELVTPLGEGFVARFLNRRGEGVHHVTLRVRGLPEQVERMRAGGMSLVGVNLGHEEWKEAFVHPRDASGVLVQIAESRDEDDEVARRHLAAGLSEAALLSLPSEG